VLFGEVEECSSEVAGGARLSPKVDSFYNSIQVDLAA